MTGTANTRNLQRIVFHVTMMKNPREVRDMALNYQKLWDLLTEKGIIRSELRQQTGITTNAMAKVSKNQSVQAAVLAKICGVLACT